MKCRSCGADIPADSTLCSFCGSQVTISSDSKSDRNRQAVFGRIQSSAEFGRAKTPERLAALPKLGMVHKAFLYVFFTLFIGGSAVMSIVALGMAGVFGFAGARAAGGAGAAFSLIPLAMSIVPIGFVVFGFFLFSKLKKRMSSFEDDPVQTLPVIVIDKRTHVWGGSGDSSAKTHYYVTCETEDGQRNEYQVWDGNLYGRMTADDAGVLFARGKFGLDFDRVPM